MTATKNNSFTGTIVTSAFKDWGDPANPWGGIPVVGPYFAPLTFTPNPATPATTITWATFNTIAAPAGIYTNWIQGHSPSPYLTDHYYPVAINIGSVVRDFSTTGSGLIVSVPTTGATGTGTFTVSTPNNATHGVQPGGLAGHDLSNPRRWTAVERCPPIRAGRDKPDAVDLHAREGRDQEHRRVDQRWNPWAG